MNLYLLTVGYRRISADAQNRTALLNLCMEYESCGCAKHVESWCMIAAVGAFFIFYGATECVGGSAWGDFWRL